MPATPLLARQSWSRRDVAQTKARRGLPPGHTNSVSISPILRFEGGVNAGADVEGVEPNLHARTRHNAR